ncbi:caspase family protein [Segatella copri]|uniref:caspase family protein n=1 Tax=Segatella copri TaxID=165179 RepID=UPI002916954E|nr:caspase family protein [Segatella copri]MDV3120105.1 caspase family protein [Segatella copri]
MEMIGILKRQAVIVLLFICFFPTMAVAQVDQFKLKQVLQDANAGDISACAYLGKMYYEGTGVAQNYNEAFKWYQKAADNGVTGAYTWLGVMYYNGQGVAQNYEKAFLWTKKAAENGAADAYVGLGVMYCKGQGVAQNYNEAFKWYQKAADNGVASAFAYLGEMYYAGDGVAQNYNEAFKWFQKAADNGITTGIYYFLADMFYTGKTGITDYSQAKKYAELAIKNDTLDIVGHRILAKLYMYGYAVEKNIDKAEALIEQALAHCKKDGSSDYPCNTMDVKGELFWVMGDKVKAKEIYDSINKNAPDFYAKIGETELSKYMKAYKEVDVDDDIPIVVKKNEKVFAVVIANEKYQMEKAVQYAKNDGRVFAEYCRKTLGLPEKNIHYVTDATLNNLKYELKWLQNVMKVYRGEAKVIFYYAGHGIPDEQNKNGYLLPIDGYGSDVTTGYALDDLFKTLGNMPSKSVTIFLDACFSGAKRDGDMLASTRGVAIKVKQNAPQGNMVVFSAAQGDETAYPYNEFEHGLFTYYLLKKLQETKGNVTLGELGDYIKTKVEQQSIVVNGKLQSPSIMSAPLIGNDWKTWKLNK